MKSITPIETKYAGCLFRSRLEARWAVYFDTLGIHWEYEMEGYQLPSGWYLPDFWLPQVKVFAEVKYAGGFDAVALRKCKELAEIRMLPCGIPDGPTCLLLDGTPAFRGYEMAGCPGNVFVLSNRYLHEGRFWVDPFENVKQSQFFDFFTDVPPAVEAAKSARFGK